MVGAARFGKSYWAPKAPKTLALMRRFKESQAEVSSMSQILADIPMGPTHFRNEKSMFGQSSWGHVQGDGRGLGFWSVAVIHSSEHGL